MRFWSIALSPCVLLTALAGCGKQPPAIEKSAERPPSLPSDTESSSRQKPPPSGNVTVSLKGKADTQQEDRKDIVVVTPRAATKLREIMKPEPGRQFLRVRVAEGEYKLDLDPEADSAEDYLGESQGLRIAIDRESARSIFTGTVVDYSDEGRGFSLSVPEGALGSPDTSLRLEQARQGFKTKPIRRDSKGSPPQEPPARVLCLVQYDAPAGKLAAYLSPDPKDGKKHPAIIWITGGDCNTIDQGCWREGSPDIDQSASAYRKAGIVMMFPSLRGGNDNPGVKEGFFGEVNDVLAAADFLQKQPFVDPGRIYLGGHSTGGTLVLLVAEYIDRFRAVFSFGPVANVLNYGPRYNPFVLSDRKEVRLRSPGIWLHSIRSPTFVFEGTTGGNVDSLRSMARTAKNSKVHFLPVKGANHFNVLGPTNRLIAQKVLRDMGAECNLAFTEEEVSKSFGK